MAMARLEAHHLEDFYAKLHREGLSGASIRKIHWAMRQSLAWAKRRGFVDQLVTEGGRAPVRKGGPFRRNQRIRAVSESSLYRCCIEPRFRSEIRIRSEGVCGEAPPRKTPTRILSRAVDPENHLSATLAVVVTAILAEPPNTGARKCPRADRRVVLRCLGGESSALEDRSALGDEALKQSCQSTWSRIAWFCSLV